MPEKFRKSGKFGRKRPSDPFTHNKIAANLLVIITGLSLNNVHESMSYSLFAELAAKQVLYNSGSIFNESFIRDGLGRITQKSETIGGVTSVYQYSYDVSGRLTDVVKDGVNVGHYSYDLNSNRTSATIRGSNISASYDSQDRIVSYNGVTYNFNAHGDLQSKSDGSSFAYDVFGGTLSVTKGGITISYQNDAEGHRVVRYKNGLPSGAFIYNELGQLVGEFDSGGAIVSSFHYASQSHSPDLMVKGIAKYYFVKDHLGSVRLVVNSSTGAIDQRIDYDEFGQVLNDSNPGFQPFGFAGGLYDPDTKLVRFGARDYDPEIGRWTSKDPILFNGPGTNLYGYTLQDPINYIDPSGNIPIAAVPAIGAAVGAIAAIAGSYIGGHGFPSGASILAGAVGGAAATLGAGVGAAAAGGACSVTGGVAAQTISLITGQLIGIGMSTPP